MQLNQCQPFEPHEPHVIFIEYDMYLHMLYFLNIWIKFPDGYQIARVWRNYACDQPVSCPCRIGVFTLRSELSFRCLLSKVIFSIQSTLYIEHCLLILPLFVVICEIWLSRLTYGVYLILFLTSGATITNLMIQILYRQCSYLFI